MFKVFASSVENNNCVQRLIDYKMLYLVCCALHFFGARNSEVHYYFQRDGTMSSVISGPSSVIIICLFVNTRSNHGISLYSGTVHRLIQILHSRCHTISRVP